MYGVRLLQHTNSRSVVALVLVVGCGEYNGMMSTGREIGSILKTHIATGHAFGAPAQYNVVRTSMYMI